MAKRRVKKHAISPNVQPKLTKKDPDFYKKIGSKGGLKTKENQPADYFTKTAIRSHQVRKERAAEEAEAVELEAKRDARRRS